MIIEKKMLFSKSKQKIRKTANISVLLLLVLLIVFSSTASAEGEWYPTRPSIYNNITSHYPQNETYNQNCLTLNVTIKNNSNLEYRDRNPYFYVIDGTGEILYGAVLGQLGRLNQKVVSQEEIPNMPYDPYMEYTWECTTTLPQLPDGRHNITIYEGPKSNNTNNIYYSLIPFYFTIDTTASTSTPATSSPNDTDTTQPILTETTALIIGAAVAGAVIALAGVTVYHFKHTPNKPQKGKR
jgi:hypothetical protein